MQNFFSEDKVYGFTETQAQTFFPMDMPNLNVEFKRVTLGDFVEAVAPVFSEVFPGCPERTFHYFPEGAAFHLRASSLERHTEFLLVFSQGQPVGWLTGEMSDAETFHIRNSGVARPFQGKGVIAALLSQTMSFLAALGYSRITAMHSVSNRNVLKLMLSKSFHIYSVEMDCRFGPLVGTQYIVSPDRRCEVERALGELQDSSFENVQGQRLLRPHDRVGITKLLNQGFQVSSYIPRWTDTWVVLERSK